MSWELFKQNILRVANSPEGISDIDVVADAYAKEYDAAVKRGFDRTHSIPLVSGNVEMMKTFLKSALQKGLTASQPYDLVGEMGEGVKAYWAGAIMATAPIPIQPAPGSTSNIQVTQNIITDVGIWQNPISSANTPADDELTPETRIEYQESLEAETERYNSFIQEGKTPDEIQPIAEVIQKFTLILDENRDYNTEVPLQDALLGKVPGALVVPQSNVPITQSIQQNELSTNITTATELQSQEEIDAAELAAFLAGPELIIQESGVKVSADNFTKGRPFVQGFKIGGGSGGAGGSGGSGGGPYVRFNNFAGNASLGERAVQVGLHDVSQGVVENPNDTGHPRIRDMHKNGGTGDFQPWCACAVTTWWLEAGFNDFKGHPNKALCLAWQNWAIATGRYVDMKNSENAQYVPKPGDAIIYDWDGANGSANHIGLFWKKENGFWWGIDGNKGAKGKAKVASHCIKSLGAVRGIVRI